MADRARHFPLFGSNGRNFRPKPSSSFRKPANWHRAPHPTSRGNWRLSIAHSGRSALIATRRSERSNDHYRPSAKRGRNNTKGKVLLTFAAVVNGTPGGMPMAFVRCYTDMDRQSHFEDLDCPSSEF